MTTPSIIFVPGSYTLLPVYQSLFDAVSKSGYEIRGLHLPTIGPSSRQGRDSPAPSMYDDAAMIAQEAERLADQGKDVIVMGHSYAGVPMSQSTKGLSKEERKARGKSGGVVELAYIACLVPPVGGSAGSVLSRIPNENRPPVGIDGNGWMLMEDPAATAAMVCSSLSPEKGEAVMRGLAKHSAQSFGNELTHAGYMDIPTSYLLCEDDLAGPPPFQREMIAMMEEASGRKVDVTGIKADHFPNLSAEEGTIEWVLEVAKKVEDSQHRGLTCSSGEKSLFV